MPCKIEEICKIAKENDLIVIEDNAESFGANDVMFDTLLSLEN